MIEGAQHAVVGKLYGRLQEKHEWCHVADDLGAVLERLGSQWASGAISVGDEHIASDTLTRALVQIGSAMPSGGPSKRCLLATVEGDDHDLGLRLAELCVRARQWKPIWLGRTTPTRVVVDAIESGDVTMVALSASVAAGSRATLARHATRIREACRRHGAHLVLGGRGNWPALDGMVHMKRFSEFDSYLAQWGR